MKYRVIWEGCLPLSSVYWHKVSPQEYQLPFELAEKKSQIWLDMKAKYPNIFDGKVPLLDSFEFKSNALHLDVSMIRFSSLTTLNQLEVGFEGNRGSLGVGCFVLSPCREYVLIGRRALSLDYCPGWLSLPGGILGEADTTTSPSESFMREIFEEVKAPLKKEANLVAMIKGCHELSVMFLLETQFSEEFAFSSQQKIPGGDNEWEGDLYWISKTSLIRLDNQDMLEGLVYYQSRFLDKKMNATGEER